MLLEGQGSVQGDSEVPWVGTWWKGITIDEDDELLAGFLGVQVEWGGSCFCLAETQAPSSGKADEVLHVSFQCGLHFFPGGDMVQQGHIVGVCIFLAGGFGPVMHVDVEECQGEDGSLGHSILQASPSAGDTISGGEDKASVGYHLHDHVCHFSIFQGSQWL